MWQLLIVPMGLFGSVDTALSLLERTPAVQMGGLVQHPPVLRVSLPTPY